MSASSIDHAGDVVNHHRLDWLAHRRTNDLHHQTREDARPNHVTAGCLALTYERRIRRCETCDWCPNLAGLALRVIVAPPPVCQRTVLYPKHRHASNSDTSRIRLLRLDMRWLTGINIFSLGPSTL